jgi:site-specific DNA-methyltransferase (adenine-specific)
MTDDSESPPATKSSEWSSDDFQIWCGDCLSLMRDRISPQSVDVVITSVPYNIGVKYANYDDNRTESEYLTWMGDVFEAIHRILKVEGSFFLNVGGTRRHPWTAMNVAEVAGRNFVLQNEIIWAKAITVDGRSRGHFTPINSQRFLNQIWEHVFHFTKQGDVTLDRLSIGVPYEDKNNLRRNRAKQDLRCGGDVWFIPHLTTRKREDKGSHPCVFPIELPEKCIRLHGVKNGMVVLDPFNGIGSTLMAASRLGVKGIGIDLSPAYCKAAEKRLIEQRKIARPMAS